jgi:glycosyltransferase involved in cell wall biosynthesis
MDLSIVIPLFNEEKSVAPLFRRLTEWLATEQLSCEVIMVDDGSSDGTFQEAAVLARSHSFVRVIKLRRNFGQAAAMSAGIDAARGDIIVTMDGDLQNDPADIPALVAAVNAGHDLAVGWRQDRHDNYITRILPSVLANLLIAKVTGVAIKDNGCTLKAYRAEVIKGLPLYPGMHRFIPALASLVGASVTQVKVRHHPRRYGESKYGMTRIYKVLIDVLAVKSILMFAERPYAWLYMAAAATGAVSCLFLIAAVHQSASQVSGSSYIFPGLFALSASMSLFLVIIGLLSVLISRLVAREIKTLRVVTAWHRRSDSYDQR